MKRTSLTDVVEKHGRKIKKYGQQLPGAFEAEAIHQLRVEYKKLRAFVRLVRSAGKPIHQLSLPSSLKSLYHDAGHVRDLQLFITQVTQLAEDRSIPLPVYKHKLQQRLFRAKEALVKAWEQYNPQKTVNHLKEELPGKLHQEAVHDFIHRKIASINILLLALEEDRELHTIRKQLKDILLNIGIFSKDWGIAFPVTAWKSEKDLAQTAALLGDYNDVCTCLDFLQNGESNTLPIEERQVLEQWKQEKQTEKQTKKQEVTARVQELHLISNFEACEQPVE